MRELRRVSASSPNRDVAEDQRLAERLCVSCAICCNGVLFRDVQLAAGDEAGRMRRLQLEPVRRGRKWCLDQPCAALDGCRCRIYVDRPGHCRAFECALFKTVRAGRMEMAAAQRLIRGTLRSADRVRRLLRALGDEDEHLAFSVRFRQVSQRLERARMDDETAERFGELTLAMHDLNVRLQGGFFK